MKEKLFSLLNQSGSLVPIQRDKTSIFGWNQYQSTPPSKDEVEKWIASGYNAFALIPGQGKFQVIDFDIKNHPNPENTEYFTKIWDGIPQYLQERLTVQTTRNKGIHFIYKCEVSASHLTIVKNTVTKKPVIETIGGNNYFLIEPSQGYQIVSGSLSNVYEITPKEHHWLISHCTTKGALDKSQHKKNGDDFPSLAVAPIYKPTKETKGKYIDSCISVLKSTATDITADYHDWISIGYAIANELGDDGRGKFHEISEGHPGYNWSKCDSTYTSILESASTGNNDVKATEVTIKQIMKKYNVDFPIDRKQMEKIDFAINFIKSRGYQRNVFSGKVEMKNRLDITDSEIDSCYLEIKQSGISIAKADVKSIINSNKIKKYDPLKEWLQECEPVADDNTITELLSCFEFKAKTPDEIRFYERMIVKWLLQAIAVIIKGEMPRLVLVLIGGTYIGKTQFFRRLLPTTLKKYYAESALDRDKDSDILMCEKLIINVDELAGIMKSATNAEKFKALVSNQTFTLRVPYGVVNERFDRKALLCGTSNKSDVIQDHESDNSRIIPVEINSINWDKYNALDRNALFGALSSRYKAQGEDSITLNPEDLKTLKSLSNEFTALNIEQELILQHLKKGERFATVVEITKYLSEFSSTPLSPRSISREMKKLEFRNLRKRVDGSNSALSGYFIDFASLSTGYKDDSKVKFNRNTEI